MGGYQRVQDVEVVIYRSGAGFVRRVLKERITGTTTPSAIETCSYRLKQLPISTPCSTRVYLNLKGKGDAMYDTGSRLRAAEPHYMIHGQERAALQAGIFVLVCYARPGNFQSLVVVATTESEVDLSAVVSRDCTNTPSQTVRLLMYLDLVDMGFSRLLLHARHCKRVMLSCQSHGLLVDSAAQGQK